MAWSAGAISARAHCGKADRSGVSIGPRPRGAARCRKFGRRSASFSRKFFHEARSRMKQQPAVPSGGVTTEETAPGGSPGEVFRGFLKLGLTSFGGPIAHLGYFRDELVMRRRWMDEEGYADLVALCQFLPGPASSQVGFSLGILRGNGLLGGLAAWLGFTMPSALVLFAFAMGAAVLTGPVADGILHGLKLVAVAVVAQAVWGMAKNLTPDRERGGIALTAVAI